MAGGGCADAPPEVVSVQVSPELDAPPRGEVRVSGRVFALESGAPLEGVQITTEPATEVLLTSASGAFVITEGVEAGAVFLVRAERAGRRSGTVWAVAEPDGGGAVALALALADDPEPVLAVPESVLMPVNRHTAQVRVTGLSAGAEYRAEVGAPWLEATLRRGDAAGDGGAQIALRADAEAVLEAVLQGGGELGGDRRWRRGTALNTSLEVWEGDAVVAQVPVLLVPPDPAYIALDVVACPDRGVRCAARGESCAGDDAACVERLGEEVWALRAGEGLRVELEGRVGGLALQKARARVGLAARGADAALIQRVELDEQGRGVVRFGGLERGVEATLSASLPGWGLDAAEAHEVRWEGAPSPCIAWEVVSRDEAQAVVRLRSVVEGASDGPLQVALVAGGRELTLADGVGVRLAAEEASLEGAALLGSGDVVEVAAGPLWAEVVYPGLVGDAALEGVLTLTPARDDGEAEEDACAPGSAMTWTPVSPARSGVEVRQAGCPWAAQGWLCEGLPLALDVTIADAQGLGRASALQARLLEGDAALDEVGAQSDAEGRAAFTLEHRRASAQPQRVEIRLAAPAQGDGGGLGASADAVAVAPLLPVLGEVTLASAAAVHHAVGAAPEARTWAFERAEGLPRALAVRALPASDAATVAALLVPAAEGEGRAEVTPQTPLGLAQDGRLTLDVACLRAGRAEFDVVPDGADAAAAFARLRVVCERAQVEACALTPALPLGGRQETFEAALTVGADAPERFVGLRRVQASALSPEGVEPARWTAPIEAGGLGGAPVARAALRAEAAGVVELAWEVLPDEAFSAAAAELGWAAEPMRGSVTCSGRVQPALDTGAPARFVASPLLPSDAPRVVLDLDPDTVPPHVRVFARLVPDDGPDDGFPGDTVPLAELGVGDGVLTGTWPTTLGLEGVYRASIWAEAMGAEGEATRVAFEASPVVQVVAGLQEQPFWYALGPLEATLRGCQEDALDVELGAPFLDDGGRFPVNVRAEYGASPDALRPMTLGAGSAFALGAGDVVLDSAEFGAEGQRVRLGWDAMYDLGPGLHRPWVRLTATAATAEAPDAVYTTRVTVDHTLRLTDGAVVGQWPREEVELVDLAAGDLSGDARLDLLALVRRLDVQQKMQMMQAELWVEEGTAFDTVNTGFVDRIGVLGLCTSPTCPQLRSMRPQALYVGSPGALAGERDTAYLWGQRSGNGASVLGEVTWEGVEEGYAARALVYGAALGAQVREGRLSDTLPHDRSAPTRELVVRTEDGRVWRHPEPLGGVMNLTPEPLFEEADGALALLGGDLNADGRGDVVVLVDAAPGVLELRALVSAPDIAQGEVQAGVVLALDAGVTVLGAHMHDMNRDGLDDLIVATDAPDVQLWLRDPSGDVYGAGDGPLEEVSFRHASTQALAAAAVDMDAADVDASRAGDVVLALGAGGWGVWHDPSRGGAFYTGEALNAGLAPDRQLGELERVERVLVYDDDRDGLGTIVVAGYSADALRIGGWEVDAPPRLCRPRWSAPQTLKPHEVAPSGLLADINGDGRPDVVLGHRGDGPLWEVAVSWGDGVGGELGATRLALDAGDGVSAPARIMAFDVDGDAYPEVVVLTEARLYVFSGAGLSASQEASPAASVELSGCAARDVVALDAEAGDGAGDGDWDLLVACDEGLALARNEGALSFAGSVSVAPGAGVGWVEVDDAARAKVFYACGDERCLGRWSDAEGALVELGRFGLSDQGPGVAADLDGDGDQDLLIVDGLPRATAYLNVGGAAQRVNVPVSVEDDVLAVAALGGVEGAWVAVLRGSDDPRAALGLAIDVLKATTREADLDVRFEVEAVVFPQAERVGDGHPRELGLAPSPHGERPELVWFGRQTQRWSGDLPLKHRPPVAAPVDIASPGGVTVAAPERGQGPRVLAWGATEGDVRLEVVDARDLDAVRVAPALTVPVGWEAPDRAAVGRLGGSAALSVALYRSSDDGGALWLRFDDAVGAWTVLRADAGALAEAMMLDVDGDGQREAYVVWRGDAGAGGWLRGDLWTMRDGGLVALPVGDGLLGDPVYGDARVAALAAGDLDADGRGDVWGWLDLEQNQSARFAYSGAASFEAFAEGAAPLVTDGQAQTTALADVRWAGVPAVVAVLRRWEEGAYAGDALVMGYGELGGLARFGPGDGGTAEVPLAQALASDVWRGLRVAPVAPEQSRYVFVDEAARGRTAMFTAHPESTGARSRGYWSWGAASAPPAFEDADGDGVADMVVLRSGGQSAQVIIAPGAARRAP